MSAPWKFRGGVTASLGGVTALQFDPDQELLWLSDTFGNLMSFSVDLPYSEVLAWSTSSLFRASTEPIRGINFIGDGLEKSVVVASQNSIRMFRRGGAPQLRFDVSRTPQSRLDMFDVDNATGILYFTGDGGLTRAQVCSSGGGALSSTTEVVTHTVAMEEGTVTAMKASDKWVVTGCIGGNLVLRDLTTLSIVENKRLLSNRVQAIDIFDNTIVASFLERTTASFIKVFDVRRMGEPVNTISEIPTGSVAEVRCYRDSTGGSTTEKAFVLTPHGFHTIQLDKPTPVFSSSRIDEGSCTCVAVSPSGKCSAIGNDKGHFIALAQPSVRMEFSMSHTSTQPPIATRPVFTQSWEENKEGKTGAFYDEASPDEDLASNWPEPNYMILATATKSRVLNIPPNIPVENRWGFLRSDAYLVDPKDKLASILPNPFPFNAELGDDPAQVHTRLLTLRKDLKRSNVRFRGDTRSAYAQHDEALQVCYGHHRFDWKSYNDIPHDVVGLDNSYPECWLTSLLQSLYLCHPPEFPVRKVLMRHLCTREYCVTCEVSIIFSNMLMTAMSDTLPIVQIQSLIRTMYQIPSIVSTGIFIPPTSRDDAVARMHLAQRVLLETFHQDLQRQHEFQLPLYSEPLRDYDNSIAALFGTEFTSNGRIHVPPRFLWEVPASALKVDEGLQHLLKQLEAYNEQVQIKRLPPIIVLLLNPEHGSLKPPSSLKISRASKEDYNYVLCSNVLHLADDADDTGNFVSHQRIRDDRFSLVNDYRVTVPMKEEDLESNIPPFCTHSVVVTTYALDKLTAPPYAAGETRPPKLFETLSTLLVEDVFAKPLQRDPATQGFKSPLTSPEVIASGDLVAIDAEYVVLDWPSSNSRDSLDYLEQPRKPYMSLARVSCLLSSKPGEEMVIIDDYVHTPETVQDYVTTYSGIHPGDLDPATSSKCLTALKATFLKLRALVDRGVRFVGHGLQQDFRVLNIAVPPDQIIDTLEIFHKPGSRYLSLRYLAYHVLGERVQEDEHDSVEDARTALRLYRKYQQLIRDGAFDALLSKLMVKGAETSWYVPECRGASYDTPTASMIRIPTMDSDIAQAATFDAASDDVGATTASETPVPAAATAPSSENVGGFGGASAADPALPAPEPAAAWANGTEEPDADSKRSKDETVADAEPSAAAANAAEEGV